MLVHRNPPSCLAVAIGLVQNEVMGIWQWLFGKRRFERFDDSFALSREKLFGSLQTAIVNQRQAGQTIWIVAHFPETYLQIGERLSEFGFDYQIVGQQVTPAEVLAISKRASLSASDKMTAPIQLVLAELLDARFLVERFSATGVDRSESISMIVIERHPLLSEDHRVERFASEIPCPVRFGYYLSIDDAVVERAAGQELIHLLRLLGMEDQQLISSTMLTRRIEKKLKQDAAVFRINHRTDSAVEWYREAGRQ